MSLKVVPGVLAARKYTFLVDINLVKAHLILGQSFLDWTNIKVIIITVELMCLRLPKILAVKMKVLVTNVERQTIKLKWRKKNKQYSTLGYYFHFPFKLNN